MNEFKDILKLQTYVGNYFFLNKNTGKWVLSESLNEKSLEYLLKEQDKSRQFIGTSMIVLNISDVCNLNCIYCHAKGIEDNKTKMSSIVGKKIIDRVFELPESDRKVVFHGREPSTNFELIQELVEYSKFKGKIEFCIQSNGTLFNQNQLEYLKEEKIGIGISLDGLGQHQLLTRPSKSGKPLYSKIISNINKIKDFQNELSIITVVSKYNVNDLDTIREDFEKKGITSVRFYPLLPSKDSYSDCPDQEILFHNMINVFNNYLDRTIKGDNPIKIINFRDLARIFFRDNISSNCVKCGAGKLHPLIAVDIQGDIYPCDFFWGRKEYKIGNIFDNSLSETFNSPFNFRVRRATSGIEECVSCDWEKFCGAGCPGASVLEGKSIASKSYYCDYNKNMFEYFAKKLPLIHEKRILDKILF